jgi:hypothetical protein
VLFICRNDAIQDDKIGCETPQIMERIGCWVSYTVNGE